MELVEKMSWVQDKLLYNLMLSDKIPGLSAGKKLKIITEVDHYDKIKLFGQGTFGKVFLAINRKDEKQYALKEVLQDKRYKNRQLSIISRLKHSNIVFMHDYFMKMVGENCYLNIIMEFVPSSLNLLIKEQRKLKKPFAPDIRKVISFQLFKALYYLSLSNVCHRDLKPPNVLINDTTYELKLCDFGSAKIMDIKEGNVSYICSRHYRAPELVLSSTVYGTEVDVWSAGCILVELLTCEPIFPGDSSIEQLIQIVKVLGTPPANLLAMHEDAHHQTFPLCKIQPASWGFVLKKYDPEPELVDLISKILTYDTEKRLTPLQTLTHRYFHDIPSYEKHCSNLPNLLSFADLRNETKKDQIETLQNLYSEPLKLKNKSELPGSTQNTLNS